ncbi:unnamed protein product [Meganyctiphanes norvegica]|uniref:C-type lectin domain-containing protein n=1 Tax=Meganyctiphanes norvegica TaxID=48144 RepID=A0AAV2RZ99_MEGNR
MDLLMILSLIFVGVLSFHQSRSVMLGQTGFPIPEHMSWQFGGHTRSFPRSIRDSGGRSSSLNNEHLKDLKDCSCEFTKWIINECPSGYKQRAGSCFYIHVQGSLSWEDARDYCRAFNGDLATPPNWRLFSAYIKGTRLLRNTAFWIGLRRPSDGSDGFQWNNGTMLERNSTLWDTEIPNYNKKTCVVIRTSNYKIVSTDCENELFLICQHNGFH